MRILMIGRGVIASVYGWALERAGHEVEFLVRPGRAEQLGSTIELDLLDARRLPWGRPVRATWPVRLRETLEPDHGFDVVVLSVAHHRLAEAVASLEPRLGSATLLVFGNVWQEPAEVVGRIPLDQVVWGFPGAGGGFAADGVLRAALLPPVTFGTLDGPPSERGRAVRAAFRSAGARVVERQDIRGWLWIHVLADAGLLSQGLRLGTLSRLIGRRRDVQEGLLTTRELLPLLEARGVDLARHRSSTALYRAPSAATSALLTAAIARVPSARRSMAAHDDPEAEEPRAIVRDVLATLRGHGLRSPRLEAAERHLPR